jgi:hypothetical protein
VYNFRDIDEEHPGARKAETTWFGAKSVGVRSCPLAIG